MKNKEKSDSLVIILSVILITISISFVIYLLVPSISSKVDNLLGINNINISKDVLSTTIDARVEVWREIEILITNKEGIKIIGANVKLDNTSQEYVTNEEGKVTFTNVTNGDHKLDITFTNTNKDFFNQEYILVNGDDKKQILSLVIDPKELIKGTSSSINSITDSTQTNTSWLILGISIVLILSIVIFAYEIFKKPKKV